MTIDSHVRPSVEELYRNTRGTDHSGPNYPEALKVYVTGVEVNPDSGEAIHRVFVEDPLLTRFIDEPERLEAALAQREAVHGWMGQLEEYLRDHEDAAATELAQKFLYEYDPDNADNSHPESVANTMKAWRELVPSAMALYPLQSPWVGNLPNGALVDERARFLFEHSMDAIGIRTRAEIAKAIFVNHALRSGKQDLQWLSIACGAAVPVFNSVAELRQIAPEVQVHATLMDRDENALGFADKLAHEQYGLTNDDYQLMQRNLIRDMLASDRFANEYDRQADMIDLLGIFEYFPKEHAATLLKKSYDLLADNGVLVFGNMLDTHPQLQVNQRAVGWPLIHPRSIAELKEIIVMAGLDLKDVTIFVPEDGVYAVVEINKPASASSADSADQQSAINAMVLNLPTMPPANLARAT